MRGLVSCTYATRLLRTRSTSRRAKGAEAEAMATAGQGYMAAEVAFLW